MKMQNFAGFRLRKAENSLKRRYVVLNRCNNDAFAQSKIQLETLQVEYMQVQKKTEL